MTHPKTLQVLALNPFHGGSHKQFLDSIQKHSKHRWTVVPGKPKHWKWRMRSSALELAENAAIAIAESGCPDVIFCTDMLDLAQWRGLLRDPQIAQTPTVIYFHENQWTYPVSPNARPDSHFGYTNLISAFAADACWFNSSFHLNDFFESSQAFVQRMPDAKSSHDFCRLRNISRVIPPGFDPPPAFDELGGLSETSGDSGAISIGWVSRWEYDKRPDGLLELCRLLSSRHVGFQLKLLGQRPKALPPALASMRDEFGDRIVHDGYVETAEEYWSLLASFDVVFSSADHEFFGIAVCEAIWAGATAVLPNRLSYPELVPSSCLYDSLEDAVDTVIQLRDPVRRRELNEACRRKIASLRSKTVVSAIDEALVELT